MRASRVIQMLVEVSKANTVRKMFRNQTNIQSTELNFNELLKSMAIIFGGLILEIFFSGEELK